MAPGALGTTYAVCDMGYADDLVSTSRSFHGLQRQADIISAFALCFNMEISVAKLRQAVFGRRNRIHLWRAIDPTAYPGQRARHH